MQERGEVAAVIRSGRARERGEVVAVICRGRARRREVRWRQSFAVGGQGRDIDQRGMAVDCVERRGCMKQNTINLLGDIVRLEN